MNPRQVMENGLFSKVSGLEFDFSRSSPRGFPPNNWLEYGGANTCPCGYEGAL